VDLVNMRASREVRLQEALKTLDPFPAGFDVFGVDPVHTAVDSAETGSRRLDTLANPGRDPAGPAFEDGAVADGDIQPVASEER
jgi:hypothetical protein